MKKKEYLCRAKFKKQLQGMNFYHIITSFLAKVEALFSSLMGAILFVFATIVNFFGGYKLAFIGVVVCILIDAFFGIWAALIKGKYANSELARDTFSKITAYGGALIVFAFVEKFATMDVPYIVNTIAALICCTELISIGGNALIVNPNLVMFRLLKTALKGEIARKLGITPEEVDDALKEQNYKRGK